MIIKNSSYFFLVFDNQVVNSGAKVILILIQNFLSICHGEAEPLNQECCLFGVFEVRLEGLIVKIVRDVVNLHGIKAPGLLCLLGFATIKSVLVFDGLLFFHNAVVKLNVILLLIFFIELAASNVVGYHLWAF